MQRQVRWPGRPGHRLFWPHDVVGYAHTAGRIGNDEVEAAIVLAVVEHDQFDQQRAGVRVRLRYPPIIPPQGRGCIRAGLHRVGLIVAKYRGFWGVQTKMDQSGQENGAGEGNRTLVFSLGSCCSTIELHPHGATSRCGSRLPPRTGRRQSLCGFSR